MFRTPLYYVFRFKFYSSTLVRVLTFASFTFTTCTWADPPSYDISDVDFRYANSKSFDFEDMDDPNFTLAELEEINEIDEALINIQGSNPEILSKSLFSRLKKLMVKKILLKYVKGFTSLSPHEKKHVMGKKLRSFRKFVSKVSGKKISKDNPAF